MFIYKIIADLTAFRFTVEVYDETGCKRFTFGPMGADAINGIIRNIREEGGLSEEEWMERGVAILEQRGDC